MLRLSVVGISEIINETMRRKKTILKTTLNQLLASVRIPMSILLLSSVQLAFLSECTGAGKVQRCALHNANMHVCPPLYMRIAQCPLHCLHTVWSGHKCMYASVTNTAYAQWTQLTPPFLSDTDHSATVSGSITLAFEHLCPHHMCVLWSSVSLLLVWQSNSGSLLTNVKGFPKSSDPLFCIVQDPLHQAKCNVLNFVQLDCTRLTRSHEVQCLELHTAPYSLLCWRQFTKGCYEWIKCFLQLHISPYFL